MAAKLNGEQRIYLETETPIDVPAIQSQLGYQYASERPHYNRADPWDCAFGEPRMIDSERGFMKERDRVVEIFTRAFPKGWEAQILYHPPNRGSAIYHWSSTEGTLHPYTLASPDR